MPSVRAVIADVLRVSEGRLEPGHGVGTFEGWDSLKHMELIVQLEMTLGLRFDGDDIATMTTVAGIEAAVAVRTGDPA